MSKNLQTRLSKFSTRTAEVKKKKLGGGEPLRLRRSNAAFTSNRLSRRHSPLESWICFGGFFPPANSVSRLPKTTPVVKKKLFSVQTFLFLLKKMSPSLPLIIFMALLSIKGMLNFRFEYNRSSFSITQTKQTFGIFSTLLQYQGAMFSSNHYLGT